MRHARDCDYEAWVFTNGYLLTPEIVELFGRCRIGHVHIPLDGIGDVNDATRRLVGGGPTYDRIIDNMGLLKPPIRVLVRGNTHPGNVGDLDALRASVLRRGEEAGIDVTFYPAALVDVSFPDEPVEGMRAYAFDGVEVSLQPDAMYVPVGTDHTCVAQNLWMVAIDDGGTSTSAVASSAGNRVTPSGRQATGIPKPHWLCLQTRHDLAVPQHVHAEAD
jgi:uncharacterized protein